MANDNLRENNTSLQVQPVILIVDDVPENLGLLHESLDQAGYRVLVTTNGMNAIEIAHRYQPDMILLDGNMPELDGFECCVQLKASPITQMIPIIFMTGLTETEHIVKGFQSGGVDYVTKPLNIEEVLIRVQTHLNHANIIRQQQQVIEATEIAILALDQFGYRMWETSRAQQLLTEYSHDLTIFEQGLKHWFKQIKLDVAENHMMQDNLQMPLHQLQLTMLTPWKNFSETKTYLVQLKIKNPTPQPSEISKYCPELTPREADVMHWLILGKTSKDIADILELSPRTINKHLEHIFEKLAVETRTSAVFFVVNRCQKQ